LLLLCKGSSTVVLVKDNGIKDDDSKFVIHLTFDDLKSAEWAVFMAHEPVDR
jgi:hypothetical protein